MIYLWYVPAVGARSTPEYGLISKFFCGWEGGRLDGENPHMERSGVSFGMDVGIMCYCFWMVYSKVHTDVLIAIPPTHV